MSYAGLFFMALGLIFFLGTVLGVHRFPDCYTRMHGAAKGDTLSSILFIIGIILVGYEHADVATAVRTVKLISIIAFIFIASPAASHALVAAGYDTGLRPWQRRQAEALQTEEASE